LQRRTSGSFAGNKEWVKSGMIKNLIVLLCCLWVSSCALDEHQGVYNDSIKKGSNVTIIKEGNYQELKERVEEYLGSRRYTLGTLANEKRGLFVFVKKGDFDLPCEIIVQYTQKPGDAQIRVDLVMGNHDLITDSVVSDDIRELAEQIKNNFRE